MDTLREMMPKRRTVMKIIGLVFFFFGLSGFLISKTLPLYAKYHGDAVEEPFFTQKWNIEKHIIDVIIARHPDLDEWKVRRTFFDDKSEFRRMLAEDVSYQKAGQELSRLFNETEKENDAAAALFFPSIAVIFYGALFYFGAFWLSILIFIAASLSRFLPAGVIYLWCRFFPPAAFGGSFGTCFDFRFISFLYPIIFWDRFAPVVIFVLGILTEVAYRCWRVYRKNPNSSQVKM
jgi:hypothetical protein